jgi:hypothetical protein
LICRASASAVWNCGRTFTWVEIFSAKIFSRGMPCAASASSCDCGSVTAEQRA